MTAWAVVSRASPLASQDPVRPSLAQLPVPERVGRDLRAGFELGQQIWNRRPE